MRVIFIKSRRAMECTLTTLFCLMLASMLVTGGIKPVKADSFLFTIYAALTVTEPYHGWQAGYHDAMRAVKTELAKIGINLELTYWDPGAIYEICWYSWWDKYLEPPKGWDMTCGEQWLYPYGLVWLGGFVYEESVPPSGVNIGPWLNPKADYIYKRAEAELDPEKRKEWLWKWQEMYMHDVPSINMFYARQYGVDARYFSGYEYTTCYGTYPWNWKLNRTDPLYQGLDREGVLIFGADETMYAGTSPMFMNTYAQEFFCHLMWDPLYLLSREPYPPKMNDTLWTPEMLEAYPYTVVPNIAAGMPVYYDGGRTAIVPLRDDVDWVYPPGFNETIDAATLGPPMTAEDVVFTFEALLDSATANPGYGDFAPVIESVEYLTDATLQSEYSELYAGYNYTEAGEYPWPEVKPWCNETLKFREPYAVRFNLDHPHADFELLLCNAWGPMIVPKFVLGAYPHGALSMHESVYKPEKLPGTGPFYLRENGYTEDVSATVDKNDWWWGNQYGLLDTIDTVVMKMLVDPGARKYQLLAHEIDFGEAVPMAVSEFEALRANDEFIVYKVPRCTSNPIRLNLNNPILANRYVRMAIAHAVPYKRIAEDVIPGWGLTASFPESGFSVPLTEGVFPYHIFEGVPMYHTELEPYGYDLDKARYYLNLYLNQTNGTPALGPVGDADQSGLVDATDWGIWRTSPISCGQTMWTYPTWPYTVDPDWNNDEDADSADKALWGDNYGAKYRC